MVYIVGLMSIDGRRSISVGTAKSNLGRLGGDGGNGSQKRSNGANGENGKENNKFLFSVNLRSLRYSVFEIRYLRPPSAATSSGKVLTTPISRARCERSRARRGSRRRSAGSSTSRRPAVCTVPGDSSRYRSSRPG